MPINLREFTQAMNEWMPQAPPEAREHLRPSTWKQLLRTGEDVDGGTRFAPQEIVERVLEGREDLSMSVALPVSLMLNSRFGPSPTSADQSARAVRPGAPAAPPEWRRWNGPAHPRREAAAPRPPWVFPAYDYSREDLDSFEESGNHVGVQVQHVEGRLHYAWPDAGDGEVYRVVVSDLEDPYSPDDFTEVAVTGGTDCWDETPLTSAVRFITVWGYSRLGGSSDPRILGQCRRVASRVIVHQLAGWTLTFDAESRSVDAAWEPPPAPPGVRVSVRTARLPLDQSVGRFLRGSSWMSDEYRIPNNGAGFQDLDVEGGKTHNYVAAVEVEAAGRRYTSPPARRQIIPDVVVEAIDDLSVERRRGNGADTSLTVRWTQTPSTSVTIYRTSSPVAPEALERRTVPVSQLAQAGLPEDAAISAAAGIGESDAPGRQLRTLENIVWPAGADWDTVHLTPVTVHADDQATIGAPVRLKRAGEVGHLTLARRREWDLVTFTWPGEATSVELRLTDARAPVDPAAAPIAVVTQDAYRLEGGVIIPGGLASRGGRLHATAVTYLEGEKILSAPTSVDVPAQWEYRYTLSWPGERIGRGGWVRRGAALFGRTLVEVTLTAIHGVTSENDVIGVALIHRGDRLPLHANDGRRIPVYLERPTKDGGQTPVTAVRVPPQGRDLSLWFDHAQAGPGYFRLMVDSYPGSAMDDDHQHQALERYCLIDPDLGHLIKMR